MSSKASPRKNILWGRKYNFFHNPPSNKKEPIRFIVVFVTQTTLVGMKIFVAICFLAPLIVLSGCQSNDVVPQKQLEGTWQVQSVETETQLENEEPVKEKETFSNQPPSQITFQSNGTFSAQNFFVPIEGTPNSSLTVDGTYEIEGNTTILSFQEEGETATIQLYFTTNVQRNNLTLAMNKDQLFLTLEAYAAMDPLIQLVLNLYKSTLVRFNLTYSFSKS